MIYLDNAATSFPKPDSVIKSMVECMTTYCANPGRSGHSMALEAGRAVYDGREEIAEFFNIDDPLRVGFTFNATHALNYAMKGVLKKGDHVVTTSMEHNSVLRPLHKLRREGFITMTIVIAGDYGYVDEAKVISAIRKNTKLIVMNHSSNVTGSLNPISEVGRAASEKGIIFLLDASQSAGHVEIDVKEMNVSMLAVAGHKGLCGPQGTGILYVKEGIELSTIIEGGTGSKSDELIQPSIFPDCIESGTPNLPGIVGLTEGVRFIRAKGIGAIREYEGELRKRFIKGIEIMNNVFIYSDKSNSSTPVVSINIGELDSSEATYILDKEYGIATRSGLHCAPIAHKTLGTFDIGTVRFSFSHFNTTDDVDKAISAVREMAKR
jgi:cysteine desulfurase / selenocysteine lyase